MADDADLILSKLILISFIYREVILLSLVSCEQSMTTSMEIGENRVYLDLI